MSLIYEREVVLEDTRVSALFTYLHNIGSDHLYEEIPKERFAGHHLLSVVTRQRVEYSEMPKPGERVIVTTSIGQSRFGLLTRCYCVRRPDGTMLCRVLAEWCMIDGKKRCMVQAKDYGIDMDYLAVEQEDMGGVRLAMLRPVKEGKSFTFTVPPAYLDDNGHMNNAGYFDAVWEALSLQDRRVLAVQTDYHAESLLGDTLEVRYQWQDTNLLLEGKKDSALRFRMKIEYAE